jgi:hypothetical protein
VIASVLISDATGASGLDCVKSLSAVLRGGPSDLFMLALPFIW